MATSPLSVPFLTPMTPAGPSALTPMTPVTPAAIDLSIPTAVTPGVSSLTPLTHAAVTPATPSALTPGSELRKFSPQIEMIPESLDELDLQEVEEEAVDGHIRDKMSEGDGVRGAVEADTTTLLKMPQHGLNDGDDENVPHVNQPSSIEAEVAVGADAAADLTVKAADVIAEAVNAANDEREAVTTPGPENADTEAGAAADPSRIFRWSKMIVDGTASSSSSPSSAWQWESSLCQDHSWKHKLPEKRSSAGRQRRGSSSCGGSPTGNMFGSIVASKPESPSQPISASEWPMTGASNQQQASGTPDWLQITKNPDWLQTTEASDWPMNLPPPDWALTPATPLPCVCHHDLNLLHPNPSSTQSKKATPSPSLKSVFNDDLRYEDPEDRKNNANRASTLGDQAGAEAQKSTDHQEKVSSTDAASSTAAASALSASSSPAPARKMMTQVMSPASTNAPARYWRPRPRTLSAMVTSTTTSPHDYCHCRMLPSADDGGSCYTSTDVGSPAWSDHVTFDPRSRGHHAAEDVDGPEDDVEECGRRPIANPRVRRLSQVTNSASVPSGILASSESVHSKKQQQQPPPHTEPEYERRQQQQSRSRRQLYRQQSQPSRRSTGRRPGEIKEGAGSGASTPGPRPRSESSRSLHPQFEMQPDWPRGIRISESLSRVTKVLFFDYHHLPKFPLQHLHFLPFRTSAGLAKSFFFI